MSSCEVPALNGDLTINVVGFEKDLQVDLAHISSLEALFQYVAKATDQQSFILTDVDRTPIDVKYFQELRSGDYWRERPDRSRKLMALSSLDSSLEGVLREEIRYPPHHFTLTQTGKANFSKLSHAVGEFLDNSLQATGKNRGPRTIRIIHLQPAPSSGDPDRLVIMDNGCGMSRDGVKDLATYYLTKAERGEAPSSSDTTLRPGKTNSFQTTFISKFGVGAIQAAFYIGTRLEVNTKTATSLDVREFAMDEAKFEERAANNEDVYVDSIVLRDAGQPPPALSPGTPGKGKATECRSPATDKRVRWKRPLLQLEEGQDQFTYIVLDVRDGAHAQALRNMKDRSLVQDLAHMYHYHLHPENFPGCKDAGSSLRHSERPPEEGEGPLEMIFERMDRKGNVLSSVNLADVKDDLESRLQQKRSKGGFKFDMRVKNPSPDAAPNLDFLDATGVLHYYPYDGTQETRPSWYDVRLASGKNEQDAISIDSDDDTPAYQDANARKAALSIDEPIFEVFWQGRLVPESHVNTLPFFANLAKNLSRDDLDAIGSNWRRRLKGQLFFTWDMPISNNKLKIKVEEGDLNQALNMDKAVKFHGGDLKAKFKRFLKDQHMDNDKDVMFESPNGKSGTSWLKVSFGADMGGGQVARRSFCKGDVVKINPRQRTQRFGEIVEFISEQKSEGQRCWGLGRVKIMRLPVELHNSEEIWSLERLHPEKSVVTEGEKQEFLSRELGKIPRTLVVDRPKLGEAELPSKIKVSAIDNKDDREKLTFRATILDGAGNPVTALPTSTGKAPKAEGGAKGGGPSKKGSSDELRVSQIFKRADGSADKAGTYKRPMSADLQSESYHFSHPPTWPPAGRWQMMFSVSAGDSPVKFTVEEVSIEVVVVAGDPDHMQLEEVDSEAVMMGHPCALPGFIITLFDSKGNRCSRGCADHVDVSCAEEGLMAVGYNGGAPRHSIAKAGRDEDQIRYESGTWTADPSQDVLVSADDVVSRNIAFNVAVTTRAGKVLTGEFEASFEAGPPASLRLLSPTGGIQVDNMAELPELEFGTFDVNGNRASPARGEVWTVRMSLPQDDENTKTPSRKRPVESTDEGPAPELQPAKMLAQTVDNMGIARFSGLTVHNSRQMGPQGVRMLLLAELSTAVKTKGKARKNNRDEGVQTTVDFTVLPSKHPNRLDVRLGMKSFPDPQSKNSFKREVGTEIAGLFVKVMDQGGEEIPIDSAELQGMVLEASWAPSKGKRKSTGGGRSQGGATQMTQDDLPPGHLPVLKIPQRIDAMDTDGDPMMTCCVKMSLPGMAVPIEQEFELTVVPGTAVAWSGRNKQGASLEHDLIINVEPAPVPCASALRSAISAVFAVDKYGNQTAPSKLVGAAAVFPSLGLECPDDPAAKVTPDRMKSNRVDGETFDFPDSTQVHGEPGATAWLVIGGETEGFGALRVRLQLLRGRPAQICIKVPSLGVDDWTASEEVTAQPGYKVEDLQVQIQDSKGHPAAIPSSGIEVMVQAPTGKGACAQGLYREQALTMPSFSVPQPPARGGGSSTGRGQAAGRSAVMTIRANNHQHKLGAATLEFKLARVNRVTDVHLRPLRPGATEEAIIADIEKAGTSGSLDDLEVVMATPKVEVTADRPLPALVLWVQTEDGRPFLPPPRSLIMMLELGRGQRRELTRTYRLEEREGQAVGSQRTVFHLYRPIDPQAQLEIGTYTASCVYTEEREAILALSTERMRSVAARALLIQVRPAPPGAPASLCPSEDRSLQLLANLSATNRADSEGARTLVADSVKFGGKDAAGVMTTVQGPLAMTVEPESPDAPPARGQQLPELTGCGPQKRLMAQVCATGHHQFRTLVLMPGVGTGKGTYRLVVRSTHPAESGLLAWSCTFHFDTDEERAEKLRDVKAQLSELEKLRDQFLIDRHNLDSRRDKAQAEVERQLGDLRRAEPNLADLIDPRDPEAAEQTVVRELEESSQELQDLDRQPVREAVVPAGEEARMQALADLQPFGQVVRLGFVKDPDQARLLSRTAGDKIRAVHFREASNGAQARKRRPIGYLAEDTCNKFWFVRNGKRMERTMEDLRARNPRLPLDPPPPAGNAGFVGYAVNMIELPIESEFLRDTLFWSVYGKTMVFDTLTNADQHRKWCRATRAAGQRIVTLDGHSMDGSGYVHPGAANDRELVYVYGELPARRTPHVQRLTERVAMLKEILAPIGDWAQQEEGLRAHEHKRSRHGSHEEVLEQIRQLKAQEAEMTGAEEAPPGGRGATGPRDPRRATVGGRARGGGGAAKKRKSS